MNINLIFLEAIENKQKKLNIISEIKKIQPNMDILVFSDSNDKSILKKLKKSLNINTLEKTISEKNNTIKAINIIDKKIESNKLDTIRLSGREKQIAKMLLDGMTSKEICEKLNLSSTTISTYKTRIFKKYNIKNILELEKVFNN